MLVLITCDEICNLDALQMVQVVLIRLRRFREIQVVSYINSRPMFTIVFGRQHHDSGVTHVHFIYSHDSAVLIQHNPAAAFQIHHNQTCLWAGVHGEYSQQEIWWLWNSGKTNLCLFIHNSRFGCPLINWSNLLAFADLWPRKDIYSELSTSQGTPRGKK